MDYWKEACWITSRWGFDAELEEAIRLIAATPTTKEQVGSHQDAHVDQLIGAARAIQRREEKALDDEKENHR